MTLLQSLLLAAAIGAMPAVAEPPAVEGQADPDYAAAVTAWLAGEDLTALEALARLSRDGNTAAQILLASIASRGKMHAHVTGEMERKDRVALLRIPGGLSGKSWLTEAQDTESLAAALLQVNQTGEKPAAIIALLEAGEVETAMLAMESVNRPEDARTLLDGLVGREHLLPDEAAVPLAFAQYQYGGSARIPRRQIDGVRISIADRAWIMPTPREMYADDAKLREVAEVSDKVVSWTPMRRFCERHCPETAGTCTAVAVSLAWGVGPFGMRSPVQSLIPNDTYWASARIDGDLARSIDDLRYRFDGKEGEFDMRRVDTCFMETMARMQMVHGHAR